MQKSENISKKDCEIKLGFYSLDYHDIETLLFSKSITIQETQKVQKLLESTTDLTKLSDSELRKMLGLCTYKSDWERFFGKKEFSQDFQKDLNDIRVFRNNVAHCKFMSRSQYEKCLRILKKTIKSLDKAINITENQDFIDKNIELLNESLKSLEKTFINLYKSLEPLKNLSTKINEDMLPRISEIVSKVEFPKLDFSNAILPEVELSKYNIENHFSNNEDND